MPSGSFRILSTIATTTATAKEKCMTQPSIRRAGTAAGHRGAAATGHPLATAAALGLLDGGGNAADAAVAAHAVLTVALPGSCGIGGDALFLVRAADGTVVAHNGTGASAAASGAGPAAWAADGGASVTAPGGVAAWWRVVERHGSAAPTTVFAPAVRAAGAGVEFSPAVAGQVAEQRTRLE